MEMFIIIIVGIDRQIKSCDRSAFSFLYAVIFFYLQALKNFKVQKTGRLTAAPGCLFMHLFIYLDFGNFRLWV